MSLPRCFVNIIPQEIHKICRNTRCGEIICRIDPIYGITVREGLDPPFFCVCCRGGQWPSGTYTLRICISVRRIRKMLRHGRAMLAPTKFLWSSRSLDSLAVARDDNTKKHPWIYIQGCNCSSYLVHRPSAGYLPSAVFSFRAATTTGLSAA